MNKNFSRTNLLLPISILALVFIAGEKLNAQNLNPAYRVEPMSINTSKSDYAPAFFGDGKIIFSSNRSKSDAVYDKWNQGKYSKLYVAILDSTMQTDKAKVKLKCKSYSCGATYNKTNNELLFSAESFKKKNLVDQNGTKLPYQQLYSASFTENKAASITPLTINNATFSSAQPALSKDGKTLYFASDKTGGIGGTDLYAATKDANGNWGDVKNLGAEINSANDEKFPFMADDGTLYFSSNKAGGLGGLDVYKTKFTGGKWTKPENLIAPINSAQDDFTFIIDEKNKTGFFSSNREGGMGEDDIYKFTYDETKLDYKVTVRVVDAGTQKPVAEVTLALDCKNMDPMNSLTNEKGEKDFMIKGGKTCNVVTMMPGYKDGSADITPKNRNGVILVSLTPDVLKLKITVKEKLTGLAVRDASVSLTGSDNVSQTLTTDERGMIETTLPPAAYNISSSNYPSIVASVNGNDVDATGVAYREFQIPREELMINVPITADCFTSTVTVTDLKTGAKALVRPNAKGEVHLDLRLNGIYLIEHHGRADTISTVGLSPDSQIEGPCKFHVGQTWVIRNIYYDFGKWTIRKDATAELDNLVRIMKENPTLQIELSSHTDCRASARFNMILSARRARAAVEYITKKGIKQRRILAAGYGESRLVNECHCEPKNDSNCNDPQHQNNRRTEVKVLHY